MTVSTDPPAEESGRIERVTYAWWGQAHPVRVLRRLRNGMLAALAVMALVSGVAAAEAGSRIGTINATRNSIRDLERARVAAGQAAADLENTFDGRDVNLTGTGTAFVTHIGSANMHITAAARGIDARRNGRTQFQFVLGQLVTSVHLAETAVQQYKDFEHTDPLKTKAADSALAAMTGSNEKYNGKFIPYTGGLVPALGNLLAHQRDGLRTQQPWLGKRLVLWPLLLLPALGVLLCVGATAHVLAAHFRRLLSPLLGAAGLIAVAVAIIGGTLARYQYSLMARIPKKCEVLVNCGGSKTGEKFRDLSVGPLMATSAAMLVLLAVAALLTCLALRPRLAEYRFGAS
ncbi:hypothetical protein [Streptomyces sp. NPDC047042]|uniref:hypothetical protein n=1 Tax=Streptomyces sp. NPDC047042 TaxID=3154807 RepID=UPI0033F7EC87